MAIIRKGRSQSLVAWRECKGPRVGPEPSGVRPACCRNQTAAGSTVARATRMVSQVLERIAVRPFQSRVRIEAGPQFSRPGGAADGCHRRGHYRPDQWQKPTH